MSNSIFPFVNLKSFPNGWKWHGKLKEFVKIKYYDKLKSIDDNKIEEIAEFLNGTLLNFKIFDSFNWALYFNPVKHLEIYFLCERAQKKGDNFTILFGKKSSALPVQDIYGFALIYLIFLSFIGNDITYLNQSEISDKFYPIEKIVADKSIYKNLIYKKILQPDLNFKKLIDDIENLPLLENYSISKDKIELIFEIFKNLKLKFLFSDEFNNIFISANSINSIPKNMIISLVGLFSNALNREYKK